MLTHPPLLPRLPGIYIFKDEAGKVLYIGKAKSLAKRIASYFSLASILHEKLQRLREEATHIEYIVTRSEQDALLLEEHLIKLYQPPYNILLASGQPFLYLKVTVDPVPELSITRLHDGEGFYYGPFTQRGVVRRAYDYLMKTFRLYRCSTRMPNGCLKYHLGICAGICTGKFDAGAYRRRLLLAQHVLDDDPNAFNTMLQGAIRQYNQELQFEEARQFNQYAQDFQIIFATIAQAFSPKRYHHDVAHALARHGDAAAEPYVLYDAAEKSLQELCNAKQSIQTIDCFDISHLQGRYMVGSCVRFTHGIPDRKKFRRFRIATLTEQNDYAALQIIVLRRYRLLTDLPDLILIDGGKGQRSAVAEVIAHTPLAALAKREERLFTSAHPEGVVLDQASPVGRLLIALRDYAHRFALNYHTLLTKKGLHDTK